MGESVLLSFVAVVAVFVAAAAMYCFCEFSISLLWLCGNNVLFHKISA